MKIIANDSDKTLETIVINYANTIGFSYHTDGNIRLSHNEINITQHKDYYLYIKAIMSYVLGSMDLLVILV